GSGDPNQAFLLHGPRYGQRMAFPPTVDDFYATASEFARNSLDAHVHRKHHLVALYAGTSLEHLAKGCLVRRSPALITELRNEDRFRSLLLLLGISSASVPPQLRTVGLRGALQRIRPLVTSKATWDHLMTLADMRDGTVHAAAGNEVEGRLVVAFVQHADALVDDLGRDRVGFWGNRLEVANQLLAVASDEVLHRVQVKIAAARADFAEYDALLLEAIRHWAATQVLGRDQAFAECAACDSQGVATGSRDVGADDFERDPDGNILRPILSVLFYAESFACPVCGLKLDSPAEIEAAEMESAWDEGTEEVDIYSPPYDEDAEYERWREERGGEGRGRTLDRRRPLPYQGSRPA